MGWPVWQAILSLQLDHLKWTKSLNGLVYADYVMYEQHRHEFMNQPRARAALLHGGLIWRLALHSFGFDDLPSVLDGLSREAVPFGLMLSINGQTYFDDELSEEEEDFICGTYHIYTDILVA
ncbi:hypothetical protein M405DRAFT_870272 [Rhizopogon salebrosus TDB-379]|nr:hypothetical protein M405DRAFT_870272 [Rhizopogon salebrosus TDB-379]